jgi:hypothetical protein
LRENKTNVRLCASRESWGEEAVAQRYCTNCGAELREDDSFCGRCGSPVHETATVATPESDVPVPPPRSKRKILLRHRRSRIRVRI